MLSHETAAEVRRLLDKPAAQIQVTVPAQRNPARRSPIRGVVIHRSRNLASEALPPWQLPRTPIADTLLDLIESASTTDDAFAWLTLGHAWAVHCPDPMGDRIRRLLTVAPRRAGR